ncbi:MAG: hypothetical protein IKL97_05280 [Eggerthellaceae bacterium]|nr:hypothetical protein [Eggerthellaceae bacterium]
MTIELTEEIVSEAGDRSTDILAHPEVMTSFIQAVYEKLVEINETIDEEEDGEHEVEQEPEPELVIDTTSAKASKGNKKASKKK